MAKKTKSHFGDQALDAALTKMRGLEPSSDLRARIMADAEQTLGAPPMNTFWPFGKIWQPVSVMLAATILGIWVGITITQLDPLDVTDEIETMVMG